jgi:hypothetical protein
LDGYLQSYNFERPHQATEPKDGHPPRASGAPSANTVTRRSEVSTPFRNWTISVARAANSTRCHPEEAEGLRRWWRSRSPPVDASTFATGLMHRIEPHDVRGPSSNGQRRNPSTILAGFSANSEMWLVLIPSSPRVRTSPST